MNEQDRNTEDILRKLWVLSGCDENQTCPCLIHALLKRTLDNYRQERERELREGADRQDEITLKKLNEDFE